jgi:hypothetical protein
LRVVPSPRRGSRTTIRWPVTSPQPSRSFPGR